MGIHDTIPSVIILQCARCLQIKPIVCCWCDTELCLDCAPIHTKACAYAQQRRFRSWKGRPTR